MINILKKYSFLSHVLFWLGIFLLELVSGNVFKQLYPNFVYGSANIIPQIIASYLTVYYLIPRFLNKKKYFLFTITFLISAYLISVFGRIIVVHIAEPMTRLQPFEQESILEIFLDIKWLAFRYFPSTYIMVLFFWLITFLNFSRKTLSLQKEKASAELKMLKSQLNPHFLFNTLNNIYSLSLDNSPKTSESIGRLSQILDYVLYRCEDKLVPLSGEIQVLEDYIALEKIRYDERLKVSLKKNLRGDLKIAPLLMLSLTENAFKHGAGEDGGSPEIDIFIEGSEDHFKFTISNTLADAVTEDSTAAIGLENIKKQLELIYPNQHRLTIDHKDHLFTVILELSNFANNP